MISAQRMLSTQQIILKVRFIAAEIPLGFMEGVHPALRSVLEPPLLSFASKVVDLKNK
jgi:hypothetical protein